MAQDKMNMQCETCAYYDYDDESQQRECMVSLDEDEMMRLSFGTRYACPYYKFYDEYKMVQKQN